MRSRWKMIVVLFIGLWLWWYWFITKKLNLNEIKAFTPSYIVLTVGNGLKLYSAIESFRTNSKRPRLYFNAYTAEKSKQFLRTSFNSATTDEKHRNSFHLFIWHEVCGTKLTSISQHPLFPHLPSEKHLVKKLEFGEINENIGMYIFGLLTPKSSGKYVLQVFCGDVAAKVWLSESTDPFSSIMLKECHIKDGGGGTKQTDLLNLKENEKYFLGILLKTDAKKGRFSVKWAWPYHINDFVTIPSSLFQGLPENHTIFQQVISQDVSLLRTRQKLSDLYTSQENMKRSKIYSMPFISDKDTGLLFPTCDYAPSYIVKEKLPQFMGQWETHYSSMYPKDETDMPMFYPGVENPHIIFGNPVLEYDEATEVVIRVMEAIRKKHKTKYRLERLLSVEQNKDEVKGSRYLVELELRVQEKNSEQLVRFSEYVFQPAQNKKEICYPKHFSWNKTAEVHYILTSAGQSRWVVHFINTMSRIYDETKDPNMNVIIVDFDTSDVDLVKTLESSSLKRYTLLKRSGKFHKTLAIQDAAATILNPDAIAVQVDLHLTIPSDFTDHVRKHTVKGKMTYSPLLTRLQCGATPQEPSGFWEIEGYGIFAMYKADWDRIGGMNVRQFKDKWGGEDWELLDTVLNHGYEVERLKIKNFNHVFHSKKKMWNSFKP